jgi:hypothetical protein
MISKSIVTIQVSRASGRGRGDEGLAEDGVAEFSEDVAALFSTGGDVAADAGEDPRAVESAEAAGDFLPGFLHADVALRAVVGE